MLLYGSSDTTSLVGAGNESAQEQPQDKVPSRIDVVEALAGPGHHEPESLDAPCIENQFVSRPLPSSLATAHFVKDLWSISYPEGIMSPNAELNVNAKQGKFRYGIFLLFIQRDTNR